MPSSLDPPSGGQIEIPRSSFTAFRMTYCNPEEMYQSSRVVSLGPIPHMWNGPQSRWTTKVMPLQRLRLVTKAKEMVGLVDGMLDGPDALVDGVENFYVTEQLNPTPAPSRRSSLMRMPSLRKIKSVPNRDAVDFFSSESESESEDDDTEQFDNQLRQTRSMDYGVVGSIFNGSENGTSTHLNDNSDALFLIEADGESSSSQSFVTANEIEDDNEEFSEELSEELSEESDLAEDNDTVRAVSVQTFDNGLMSEPTSDELPEKPVVAQAFEDQLQPPKNAVTFNDESELPQKKPLKRKKSHRQVLRNVDPEPQFFTEESLPVTKLQLPHFHLHRELHKKAVWARARLTRDLDRVEKKLKLDRFFSKFAKGEVIKVEKMLVMVLGDDTIRESTTGNRIIERWKEYVVVARSRNDYDEPLFIQFFNHREVSILDDVEQSKSEFDFKVNLSTTSVRPYSALDKNICVTVRKGEAKIRYILQCQAQSSSLKWLHLFQIVLGQSTKGQVTKITLPHLGLRLGVKLPKHDLAQKVFQTANMMTLTLYYDRDGYRVSKLPVYEYVIDVIMKELMQLHPERVFSQHISQRIRELMANHSSLAFAWRHYDRLEWVFGENIKYVSGQILEQTHDLELRQMVHYSRKVVTPDGLFLHEPPPVEGFLVLLTNRGGQTVSRLGRSVYRLIYCFTNDNLLMFSRFSSAVPYFEETDVISPTGEVLDQMALLKACQTRPDVLDASTYPLTEDGHITWLNPSTTKEQFSTNDRKALLEMERRAAQVVRANGIVDLCEVMEINEVDSATLPRIVCLAASLAWTGSTAHAKDNTFKDAHFEIVLRNGSRLIFQAPSSSIRQEWMSRLRSISEYWIHRKHSDLCEIIRVRERNMNTLNVDEYTESTIAQSISKWENSMGSADPNIYPITSHAMTRSMVKCGVLYQKPKRHASFRKYYVVLCPGFLLLYRMFRRSKHNNTIKPTTYFRRYMSIPLKDCYVYSGESTALDLLERDKTFDHLHPGHHSLPRVYPDGWKSSEEEPSRCFTIWFGSKRVLVQNAKGTENNLGIVRTVNRLGVTGRSAVFMARSRQERDMWVTNISVEIERFATPSHSDIKLH